MGHIFYNANLNWERHLELVQNFWSSLLLNEHTYSGNPMMKHIELNKQYPLIEVHFHEWMQLFQQTVDELYEGVKAEEAKTRTSYITQLMQY